MKLYHGTNTDFSAIDLNKSKPNKDFGKGFYLSADFEQAADMARAKIELLEYGTPIVQTYEIDESALSELKVLRFEEYSEEWAKFILLNRYNKSDSPVHDYDIVIGPIADDRVGRQLWRYENGDIDLPTLMKNLRYMKGATFQYFFGTERAISKLRKL